MHIHPHLFVLSIIISACSSELDSPVIQPMNDTNGMTVRVSAPNYFCGNNTKASISDSFSFSWATGDKIGIFPNKKDAASQTTLQLMLALSAGEGLSSAYSSTTGWTLDSGGLFNYFSYFPYNKDNSRETIMIDYTGQVQLENNSTTGLGLYEYMYSDIAEVSESSAAFVFHHIGCILNVEIDVPDCYNSTTFYKMKLIADAPLFTSTATYSVKDIVATGNPSICKEDKEVITLSFGNAGIQPKNGVINAWIMMYPAQWNGKTITVNLYADKNNVPTISGSFTPENDQTPGTKYAYKVSSHTTGQILPDKPLSEENLHILLFSHSFGTDCTSYLPAITKAAGITNVHFGRWFKGNCSLATHWNYVSNKEEYSYYDSNPAKGNWGYPSDRKVDDVLAEYPWDIILFQQSVGFGGDTAEQPGEGSYKSYQPHLNYLTHYVDSVCIKIHNKRPVIGWNMCWGFNNGFYTDYDRGATGPNKMYEAIVQAVNNMSADKTKSNEIPIIIPVGTAIQNARGTSLNDPGSPSVPSTTKLLTRDGLHVSVGIGLYTAACTWFQYLIAPIFGVDITDNTYRPYPYILNNNYSFEGDQVTDERAAICWKCAKAAVEHPYVVTPIIE